MTRKQKKTLLRIVCSAVLLAAVWILDALHVIPDLLWIKLACYLLPYLLIGWDVLWDAIRNILHGQLFDEQFLMTLATVGALVLGEYREAVAVMLFYQLGEWFQGLAVGRSRRNIAELMDIRPDRAVVLRDGEEISVDPEEVEAGEVLLVRPGERLALDGTVVRGVSSIDAAALTGESLPRDVGPGDTVVSGTVNLSGVLEVQTSGTFGQSTVARILELVENASEKKARVEGFITRFARIYTPCVVVGAVLLAVLPPLLTGQAGNAAAWSQWVHRALAFLVVSCPCALVISVPLSFFGGIGGASRAGILIKGANDLENLSKLKTVVFDKTGTLTEGRFAVAQILPAVGTEQDLLRLAAAVEQGSNHPIARSILDAAKTVDLPVVSDVREIAGKGLSAIAEGKTVLAGNRGLLEDAGIPVPADAVVGTPVYLAADGVYLGALTVSDRPKDNASAALGALRALGVEKTVMLTGDKKEIALALSEKIGLDEVHAELLPQEKVAQVEALLDPERKLAFVGDGINDAPVLTRADVGIAMGALGSDAAIEAADVVLMNDDLNALPKAVRIARKTMQIVRQNIALSLGVKAAILILGALGVGGLWLAIFADVGVMLLAVLNALRAMRVHQTV